MMGRVLRILGFIMAGCVSTIHAQNMPEDQQLPNKEKVSKDLILLRDSVNSTISALSQREINATDPLRPAYMKMTQDLNRYKIQLDRAVEEVVNREWSVDVRTRTTQTVADVRREHNRIQSEIRQEPKTDN
jgi:hypothetical protein